MSWNLAWPGGKRTVLTFSFDDGQRHDIRLIAILNKFGFKGTFNLNSGLLPPNGPAARKADYVRADEVQAVYRGHEVAAHGVTHAFLNRLDHGQRCAEIFEDRKALEALTGYPITGAALAFGATNPEATRDLTACGLVYCRCTGADAWELPDDWMSWKPTCHQNGFPQKLEYVAEAKRPMPQLMVFGHSYEFPRDNTWERFESDCAAAAKLNVFWAATCMEIFDYVTDFRRLAFGAEGRLVRNPTGRDLWLARGHAHESPIMRVPANTTMPLE